MFQNQSISLSHQKFIRSMDLRFPRNRIAESFEIYLSSNAQDRIAMAAEGRKKVLHDDWFLRGIPEEETETLDEHIHGMKEIGKTYLSENLLDVLDMTEAHKTGKVITGHFTRYNAIETAELRLLGMLATRVIYQARPEMIRKSEDYQEQRTPEAKIVYDLNQMQTFMQASFYHVTHPEVDLSDINEKRKRQRWLTREGQFMARALSL